MRNMKRVARFEKRGREILVDYEDIPEAELAQAITRLLHGEPTASRSLSEDCMSHSRGPIMLQVIDYDPKQDPYRTLGKVVDGMTCRKRVPRDGN